MVRVIALVVICALLFGCAADYTIVFPPDAPLPTVIDAPRDAMIDCLEFVSDGQRLICSGSSIRGNTISLIDVSTREVIRRFDGWPVAHAGGLLAVYRVPDTVSVYALAAGTGSCLWTHKDPNLRLLDLAVLHGGERIQVGGSVRNMRTGAWVMDCERGAILTDDLSLYATLTSRRDKDGKALLEVVLKSAADKTVKWTCRIQTPCPPIHTKAEFDEAGRTLLIHVRWHRPTPLGYRGPIPAGPVRFDGGTWAIDAATGERILPDVVRARFTADRKALLAQQRGTERLFLTTTDGRELVPFSGLYDVVSSLSGVVAGQTGTESGSSPVRQQIQFFDSRTGRLLGQARLPGNRPWDCDLISDDGRFLVLKDGSGLERCVIATSTGDCILHVRGDIGRRNVFTFSFARRVAFADRLFAVTVQKQILVFDLDSLSHSLIASE